MGRLDGVRAVITGGASGIEEATARLFVAEGAAVVIADIDDDRGHWIASELAERCRYVHADVSQDGAVDAAVAAATAAFGGLDCLFNNAGNPGSTGRRKAGLRLRQPVRTRLGPGTGGDPGP